MERIKKLLMIALVSASVAGSTSFAQSPAAPVAAPKIEVDTFQYVAEMFADDKVLRYKIPGFERLTTKEKELLYYLYEAALAGRDIYWDQGYKHNLCIRRTLEAVLNSYKGDKKTEQYQQFLVYAKRIMFANGIHHQYSEQKIMPEFSKVYFAELVAKSDIKQLPLQKGEPVAKFVQR
ncbi:MAG: dihydrofolate reductase, partial [Bacteroidia bacterium]